MAAYFVRSAAAGAGTGADWANAYTTIALALARPIAAGDTLWIADDHAESTAGAINWSFPGSTSSPNYIMCVDHLVASPGTGDLKTTGTAVTTGANNIVINGNLYMYGLQITAGSGATGPFLLQNNSSSNQNYEACKFILGGTSGGTLYPCNTQGNTEWKNCTIKFSNAGSQISGQGTVVWTNTAGAVDVTTVIPTNILASFGGSFLFDTIDLSALTGKTLVSATMNMSRVIFKDCDLNSTAVLAANPTYYGDFTSVDSINTDYGSTATYRVGRVTGSGTLTTSTAIVRTAGASNGTTPVSWKIATTVRNLWHDPFQTVPLSIWNTTTGSAVTLTVEGIADPRDFSALPLNDDFWFDVEYFASGSTTLGSFTTGSKANRLATGTSLTASTQAWDSQVTARLDNTVYVAGDIIKASTNAGRLFVCTTGGTTAGSIPAGYASAVDGGTVTDNTATFKAMWRFKLSVATGASVALIGPFTVYPKVAKASLNGIYIDPFITISGVTINKTFMLAPGVFQNEISSGGSSGGGLKLAGPGGLAG